jgi:NAD(P)-dependent dehydrogenase (short-subunit alcohol dehydrogenase family)
MVANQPEGSRVAIVTGGAQGLGRAIALRLAADGLDVVIADLSSQTDRTEGVVAEIKKLGRRSVSIECDVSQEQEVKTLVEKTVTEFGRLDVVRGVKTGFARP